MEMNELKFLSDEDKTRYMIYERLFSQPGWANVEALCMQLATDAQQRAAFAKTWEENRVAIGNALAYNHVANLRDLTESEYSQKATTARDEAQAIDELANE